MQIISNWENHLNVGAVGKLIPEVCQLTPPFIDCDRLFKRSLHENRANIPQSLYPITDSSNFMFLDTEDTNHEDSLTEKLSRSSMDLHSHYYVGNDRKVQQVCMLGRCIKRNFSHQRNEKGSSIYMV